MKSTNADSPFEKGETVYFHSRSSGIWIGVVSKNQGRTGMIIRPTGNIVQWSWITHDGICVYREEELSMRIEL